MPASSMCCMMPPMTTSSPSRQRVDINFGRVFQEVVDQHRALLRILDRLAHVRVDRLVVVGRSPSRVRRARTRGAPAPGSRSRFALATASSSARRGRARRLRDVEFFQQLAEALAIFGQIDGLGRGADDRDARGFQRQRQVQRRLSAELHDDADRCAACASCS